MNEPTDLTYRVFLCTRCSEEIGLSIDGGTIDLSELDLGDIAQFEETEK